MRVDNFSGHYKDRSYEKYALVEMTVKNYFRAEKLPDCSLFERV